MDQGDRTTPAKTTEEGEHIRTVTPGEDTTVTNETATAKADIIPPSTETPTTDEVIAQLQREYNFDYKQASTTAVLEEQEPKPSANTIMMFAPPQQLTFPALEPEEWKYAGRKPTPITIGEARRNLASAYAVCNCEAAEAGVHGYAWMVEKDEVWLARDGVSTVPIPTKTAIDYDPAAYAASLAKNQEYKLYHHLVQEGKKKLLEWFGKSMFHDLWEKGALPVTRTPRDLLEHLEQTYGTPRDYRISMEQVEIAFNKPYDPKKPIETYFMHLEEACSDADALGRSFTEQQKIDKALSNFEGHFGKDADKAEDKWDAKTKEKKTWSAFKTHWKTELHKFDTRGRYTRRANQAITEQMEGLSAKVEGMQVDMSAIKAENRNYEEENHALSVKHQIIQEALQAEHTNRQSGSSSDDISTLTDALSRYANLEDRLNAKIETLANNMGSRGTATTVESDRSKGPNVAELLAAMETKPPSHFSWMSNGKGLQYRKICWKCGCNTTHWTRQCPYLSKEQKERYKKTNFQALMGGSDHHIERKNKWQADFGFDSW